MKDQFSLERRKLFSRDFFSRACRSVACATMAMVIAIASMPVREVILREGRDAPQYPVLHSVSRYSLQLHNVTIEPTVLRLGCEWVIDFCELGERTAQSEARIVL